LQRIGSGVRLVEEQAPQQVQQQPRPAPPPERDDDYNDWVGLDREQRRSWPDGWRGRW
jgi:hypothetical protein